MGNSPTKVSVDLSVYGLTAVLKSAYRFSGRAYLHVQDAGGGKVDVWVRAKDGSAPDQVAGEFLNDLLDQRLREIVATETRPERDLILAHALSRTNLVKGPQSS